MAMDMKFTSTRGVEPETDRNVVSATSAGQIVSSTAAAQAPLPGNLPANAKIIDPVDDIVRLPAGTRLDAIRISGTNLVITLPDGQVLVVVDGALYPPQIVLGTINISAANIAALIAGQEPEPAAGAPQSSGGNFFQTPTDIGDPFDLGDLLPPTEFSLLAEDSEELIPAAIDSDPVISIVTPDQPAGSTAAAASVSEAGLAARGVEPAGSDPASTSETVTGTIQINSPDQPNVIAVNGTPITAVGQTIVTPLGIFTITSIAPDAIGYSYTLVDNSTDPDASDVMLITITDSDGDVASATLTLTVTDDAPTARADTEVIAPNLFRAQTGNVITGIGTTSGSSGADTLGADGATVTGFRASTTTNFTSPGGVIQGQYGTLLMLPNGAYSYVRAPNTPGGVQDVFTYQLTDGDGDISTTTLTFDIGDSSVGLVVPSAGDDGTVVDEAGLSERAGEQPGSRDGDGSNLTFGTLTFTAPDGPATVTINGVVVTGVDQEIEMPTGTFFILSIGSNSIEYAFLLKDNVTGSSSTQPVEVTVTDRDGDSSSASFVIEVIDDKPVAVADTDLLAAGQFGPVTGNVITDAENNGGKDIQGADGATVLEVSGASGTASAGTAIAGLYGILTISSDGSYNYVRNAGTPGGVSDVFSYTLIDGDGDTSSATLTISIENGSVSLSVPSGSDDGQLVAEAGLPQGSASASNSETTSGFFTVTVIDGPGKIFIDGVELNAVGQTFSGIYGQLTITAIGVSRIEYSYTLSAAGSGESNFDDFSLKVVDQGGDQATGNLVIAITDDVPTALADPLITIAEDSPAASGNLLANDIQGADGAIVTSVEIGGQIINVQPTGITTHTNTLGTYTFQADGIWTFDPVISASTAPLVADFTYTITDGDGDISTAQQQIRILDGADPLAGLPVSLILDDQNLASGSAPSLLQPVTVSGQIEFTPGSDAILSIVFGDVSQLDAALSWTRESDTQIIGWDFDKPVIILDLVVTGTTATIVATLESNFAYHADTLSDDIAALGQVQVIATDQDGDQALGTVSISVSDDVPTITTNSSAHAELIVDESNLAIDATADFSVLFTMNSGADEPASIAYSFATGNNSGLTDVATGSPITLISNGNVLEGRVGGANGVVAFRLTVASNGEATLDQIRAIRHNDPTNPDDAATISAPFVQLIATITDSDGDQASATVSIGNALVFKDDGPTLDVGNVDTNNIVLTTQDGDTRNNAFDTATANLSQAFSIAAANYGADGSNGAPAIWSYSLALGPSAAATGLFSNGIPVTLALVAGEIIGSASGTPVFSVKVDPVSGTVTLTQFAELDHPLPGTTGNYANQLLELPANLIELRGTATITDRDGDSVSDVVAVDLGGNIRFADDGPSISANGSAPELILDESHLAVDVSADLSGLFAPTLDFGADGSGNIAYSLGVTAGPSGLIDSMTGEAVLLSVAGGTVFGRTSTHEVFRITVSPDGVVTFDQSRAILHNPDTGPDQTKFMSGVNLITLTAIVTDGDGDTAQTTADITGYFAINDDAPVAINDEDSVARDGLTFADGNVLTGLGGVDENGTDGSTDNAGNDGGLVVSAISFGATSGTLGSALAGEYGSLTLAADGTYRYDLDILDPAVIALNSNQTLTDTFIYTVTDADGDTSTATVTISITGANDFPLARADTNWVLDGASGSDPSAVGNVLLDINHPGAPAGAFADVADNDPDLEPITVTSAGTYTGLYGTLIIAANGEYTYTLNEDLAAVNALDAGQTLVESFAYTISDGLLSVPSTLTITVFGTNDAPTIGAATARISEEGLVTGIADADPDAALDTTNNATVSGVLAIGDLDAGETLTATLGDPGAALTAGGVPVTWTGIGTGTLVGSADGNEVIRVTLASNGAYTVSLSRAVDHPIVALEDLKEFTVPVSVFDGTVTTTNASAIRIVIEDDAPTANGETGSTSQFQQDVNTLFILDFSDSIDNGELDVMLDAVKNALSQLDSSALSALTIKFVIFSSGSFASPSFTTAAEANAYLDSLNPAEGGIRPDNIGLNTNYTSAIQTALANFTAMPGASNQVFFLSDGNPNQGVQFSPPNPPTPPSVINSLTNATASAWNNFVDGNNINVTSIGIDNNPLQPLNIERLRDIDLNAAPDNEPILVEDFEDLVATLLSVVVPSTISGDLGANDAFGADGGRLLSITVGAITYTWDGTSDISVSSGGTIAGSLLTILTPVGATLEINFATGQYNYQPPSPITVSATEVFSYTIVDADGDTATASLSVSISALAPPVVLDLDGDGVEFVSSAAGVAFDYDGDGNAESTAWVASDDGLLVLDRNGDGKVNGGSEIVFAYGGLTDLQGLAADYDSNNDGKLDANDAAFSKFAVWRDGNSNGTSEHGELVSLTQAGIASISLISDNRGYTAANGEVIVRGEADFTWSNGSKGKLADAAFATNFVTDVQRTLSIASTGIATALFAAASLGSTQKGGVVSENPMLVSDDMVAFDAMVEPRSLEAVVDPEFELQQSGHQMGTSLEVSPRSQFDVPEEVYTTRLEDIEQELPPAALASVGDEMPAEVIGPDNNAGPLAAPVDQVMLLSVEQIDGAGLTADKVTEIVADAIEGRSIDLDAVLAAYSASENSSLPAPLHDTLANAIFMEGQTSAAGNMFMPDIAGQQVMAQIEQAATFGHA